MKACLIVEDSRLARVELKNLIESLGHFETIHVAENAEKAIKVLEKFAPEVIFLDIHLPGMNGFEFLESLDHIPKVIFTTAYDEYAIKSFEYNAIDYLLKPIRKERLEKAIEKITPTESAPTSSKKTAALDQQVFVRDGEKCWFVKLEDIRIFESVGNYSRVYFETNKPLIQKSLNYLEEVLDETVFVRVNRQQIVNLNYIEKIDVWFSNKLKIVMKSGEEIEVSRRQAQRIKSLFSL